RIRIGRQEVNFAVELLGFAGSQSADARVVVQADDHALKQLLRLVPCHRQKIFAVLGKTADEAVDRFVGTDRARVHVFEIDSFRPASMSCSTSTLGSTKVRRRRRFPSLSASINSVLCGMVVCFQSRCVEPLRQKASRYQMVTVLPGRFTASMVSMLFVQAMRRL